MLLETFGLIWSLFSVPWHLVLWHLHTNKSTLESLPYSNAFRRTHLRPMVIALIKALQRVSTIQPPSLLWQLAYLVTLISWDTSDLFLNRQMLVPSICRLNTSLFCQRQCPTLSNPLSSTLQHIYKSFCCCKVSLTAKASILICGTCWRSLPHSRELTCHNELLKLGPWDKK